MVMTDEAKNDQISIKEQTITITDYHLPIFTSIIGISNHYINTNSEYKEIEITAPTHSDNIDSTRNVFEYKTNTDGTESGLASVPSSNSITHNFYGGGGKGSSGQPRYVKWRVTDAGGKSRIEQQTLNIIDDYGPRFLNQDQDGTNTINITVNSDTDTVNATVNVSWIMDNLDGYLSSVNYTVQNSSNLSKKRFICHWKLFSISRRYYNKSRNR